MRTLSPLLIALAPISVVAPAGAEVGGFEIDSHFTGQEAPAIDGDLGEWSTESGEELVPFVPLGEEDRVAGDVEWEGDHDIAADLGVAHNGSKLFVAVRIRDQRFVRSDRRTALEDHVAIWLGIPRKNGREAVGVGLYTDPTRPEKPGEVRWVKEGAPRAKGEIRGASAAVQGDQWDYSVEAQIPWSALRCNAQCRRDLRLAVFVIDCDMAAHMSRKNVLGTAPIEAISAPDDLPRLAQRETAAGIDEFRKAMGVSHALEPMHSIGANIAGDRALEEIIVLDKYLVAQGGAVGPSGTYAYTGLPVEHGDQVKRVEPKNILGDRRSEIVIEYREDNLGTVREWVEIYRVDADLSFQKVFAAATLVESGDVRLENSYRFARGPGKAKAVVVEPGEVRGADAESLEGNVPDEDGNAMVLPWDEPPRARYVYRDGAYVRE